MRLLSRTRRQRQPDPDPGTPHRFRSIDDAGIGVVAAGGGGLNALGTTQVTSVITADNLMRKGRCGVPGCNREQDDPIHNW